MAKIDTLIVWNEPESEEDLALSFVDKKSCLELWYFTIFKLQMKVTINLLKRKEYVV